VLSRANMPLDHARAHLLHGEWLRREGRRPEAMERLRTAHRMFTTMGALGFADRARVELHAAGSHAIRHPVRADRVLTSQEEQAARLAGRGLTNQEIATSLFISENTVAYHLKKVFKKLGIASRRELGALMARHDSGE
jgi:DNA-binding CsgD family transcriptional regulator